VIVRFFNSPTRHLCQVASNKDAIAAAITEPWSSGQVEGNINRLKLIKRQMFGRANLDLLKARLMAAA
jgi:transposase